MKLTCSMAMILFFAPALAKAQSPWDGTWKFDEEPARTSDARFEISLGNGEYSCRTCQPPWAVPADGVLHPIAGHEDFDETSVQVVDERKVVFRRSKGGREVYRAVDDISEDGNRLDFSWTESSNSRAEISGSGSWIRVKPLPADHHPITGTWRELRPNKMSDNTRAFTLRVEGDRLMETFGTGESMVAEFGGPPSSVDGDPTGTLVSVRRISDKAFEESDSLDGEIIAIRTMTLLDRTTLEIVSRKMSTGKETRRLARLQANQPVE